MRQFFAWVILLGISAALGGCGQRDAAPVTKPDPLPTGRFPQPTKK